MIRLLGRIYDRVLYQRMLGKYGWEPAIFDYPDPEWADARTLDDLGELTARWLEGRIARQPGYGGPVDTDEDLAPGMTAILAACNRDGFITYNSEAASLPHGQHSDVSGFTHPGVTWPSLFADRFDVTVWTEPPPLLDDDAHEAWFRDHGGYPGMDVEEIEVWFRGRHPDALAAANAAWQVTIFDPVPGSQDLWPALAEVFGGATS